MELPYPSIYLLSLSHTHHLFKMHLPYFLYPLISFYKNPKAPLSCTCHFLLQNLSTNSHLSKRPFNSRDILLISSYHIVNIRYLPKPVFSTIPYSLLTHICHLFLHTSLTLSCWSFYPQLPLICSPCTRSLLFHTHYIKLLVQILQPLNY